MILEAKYPQLQPTVSIYDTKIMNHMVFSMLNQKPRADVQVTCQNKKPLVKFGAFSEVTEEVQAPVNATVADEHDVEIIDAAPGSSEPVENVDLTGIVSEEDAVVERMMDNVEFNENVVDDETEVNAESLTAEVQHVKQPTSVNPPHTEPVDFVSAEPENVAEDPTADLHPRKRSKRNPRISREINTETKTTQQSTMPVVSERPPTQDMGTPVSEAIIDFILNERAAMFMPAPRTGEGSSSGPSNADVLKAAELLQVAAREAEAAAKPNQDKTQESSSSPDSEEFFADNETDILMKRITVLEEGKIFKDVQIAA
ncbi:hypothetical protein HanRHA438_Chr11g0514021 [Helianthus annuus]|uniref:Uncharacterized protein n=1 Tax=Helianthus annuus TaxID=4232 RepID=A0A9K3N0T7_HELAN|nr:hypothetical protein HanXRQr2_Chr11g0501321 [Helianthus annuus]KAJ0502311.1 hypothetical protein HanHA300_Chr11g0411481 [Helianthus annuus]KAJ0510348.1 hypothetical protein HanIR_Chr11g0539811 [Helianthus annuus]KAJ0518233.1 hypothetical protein HanHA89_Chr11g0435151 [Helianthus annuus]KAJ0686265.1 hypothetical protein HanLR1_Chr11g0412811 [Helianthus annuus]